ncbi:MAG: type II toxin-antitoxin system RelE/ParE family toxin [Sphingomonadales bacterium]|nr:type II toxin-antitoxin system RelE/ParE family toxin [Sphingomonadales bacterium]
MAKLRLTSDARADLADIDDWSFQIFGRDVADEYIYGLQQAFALLRKHPQAGQARPEIANDIRCLIHRSHRIFYSIENDLVLIRRVVHSKREAKRLLQ